MKLSSPVDSAGIQPRHMGLCPGLPISRDFGRVSEELVAVLDTRALAVVLYLSGVMLVRHLHVGVLLTSWIRWVDAASTGFCTLILLAAQGVGT